MISAPWMLGSLDHRRGLTVLELLTVLLSMTIVGGMAFHLLVSTTKASQRNLSGASRADRLGILLGSIHKDLGGRYPNASSAPITIGNPGSDDPKLLLRTEILKQSDKPQVELVELLYRVENYPKENGRPALLRTVDPNLEIGAGPESSSHPLFLFEQGESLIWEATPETVAMGPPSIHLRLHFENENHEGWPVIRDTLIVGSIGE